MAAHTSGVDWVTTLKPFLNPNYSTLSKNELVNVIKIICKSENDFIEHDAAYEPFYMAFSVLAADSLAEQCTLVCQSQVLQMIEASAVLVKYMLNRLKASGSELKWFLPALKALCEGKHQTQSFDRSLYTTTLKSSKFPESTKNVSSNDKDSPKSEIKRSRSDLSAIILHQLTTPYSIDNGNTNWTPLTGDLKDNKQTFTSANISYMKSLNAGDIIIQECSNLSTLTRYRNRYEEYWSQNKTLFPPLTTSEATYIKSCSSQIALDITTLYSALSLPVLEPLTSTRIVELSKCALSALYCAVLVSTSNSVLSMPISTARGQPSSPNPGQTKDVDDNDENICLIVDKSLEIFEMVGKIYKSSARGYVYLNHIFFGAWFLITGIPGSMGAFGASSLKQNTDEGIKGRSPSKNIDIQVLSGRVSLCKVQQGFGILNVAIASHFLILLTELIDDLKIESHPSEDSNTSNITGVMFSPEATRFDVLEQYSSVQRVFSVISAVTMNQLLTILATVSYRKACYLKRVSGKDRNDCDAISFSDSTTYFNDTLSCSEDSESEEEDSESYLGLWFKETLSPENNEEGIEPTAQEKTNDTVKSNLVPAKDEPHEYLELSAQIFKFLDRSLGTNHELLNNYVKSGLSDQQMVLLANILKDLDRDSARTELETSNTQWQLSMAKFSGNLGRYLHNLISGSLINETLQSSLLLHLGVSPWTQDSNIWPLQVYSRTLSVLAQILLLKPPQEKEAACLSVWHRLVNTLVEGVCSSNTTQNIESDWEDLNVEHAQLLLFLFHSLNLMQKKSILLLTAGGVIRCAEVCRGITPEKTLRENQLMLLSRLLLFLEYLMKHLYNAPTVLLEQVRWNLFSVIAQNDSQKNSDFNVGKAKIVFRTDIEETQKKNCPSYSNGVRPKFYSLVALNNEFKLDGLAWNFILCTPDKLKYPLLVDALIDILSVTDICTPRASSQILCAVHYCFSLCFKLLIGLPPSTPHVEALVQDKNPNLHSLLWSIKCIQPAASSHYLIVNSLIKQGMYTQYAESLWNTVTEHVSDVKYSLLQTIHGVDSFNKSFNPQNLRLTKIILLDAIVSNMFALLLYEKEAIKPLNSSVSNTEDEPFVSRSSSDTSLSSSPNTSSTTSEQKSEPETETNTEKEPQKDLSRDELTKDLVLILIDAAQILRDHIFKIKKKNVCKQIPSSILENLLAISGFKDTYCSEVGSTFFGLISGPDKEKLTEWKKNLSKPMFIPNVFTVENYVLAIIESHLVEMSKYIQFSDIVALKHTLEAIMNLICVFIHTCDNDDTINEKLKPVVVPMLFDIRSEYLHDTSNKCLERILNTEKSVVSYEFVAYCHILEKSYRIILDYATISNQTQVINVDEAILHSIILYWEQILDKPEGIKAVREFFCISKKGSLIEIILSFANTQMSQSFSTKILQFFEKLLQIAEKSDSPLCTQELAECIAELGQIDSNRLKSWLSHIILGPRSANTAQPFSTTSSNAQTPTNMATVSGVPSFSDQAAPTSETEPMEADLSCAGGVATTTTATSTQVTNVISTSAGALPDRNDGESNEIEFVNTTTVTTTTAIESTTPGAQSSGVWYGNCVLINRSDSPLNEEYIEQNGKLLQTIIKYLVCDNNIPQSVSTALFQGLVQLGNSLMIQSLDIYNFKDLLYAMITLADAGKGKGHYTLFTSAIEWLEVSKHHVLDKALPLKLQTKNNNKPALALENVTILLRYMVDILHGLGFKRNQPITAPWEEETLPDFEDIFDDLVGDDDESVVEDSDEDSLGNKLCTFSQTQKEFMNQHWYHCHTCNMVDGVGVCSVCARVCHKKHDISYSKYGNFFCDCGAKEDGSCQALIRRTAMSSINQEANNPMVSRPGVSNENEPIQSQSVTKRPIQHNQIQGSGGYVNKNDVLNERIYYIVKSIETSKDSLMNQDQWKTVVKCLLEFLEMLLPSIRENCQLYSIVGCHRRAKNALNKLHDNDKTFQITDQIMVATLGSQEGAFENVRMSYSGEQGQTIKQLLSSGLVRRVALCCLSSPHGKRQHLAVSHEKGKVTILQLSALLKQADAAKRKLTLTQLASAPLPCTIISLAANPANEDCLAVCGLKECHILTFSNTGTTTEHIVLTPHLEIGNFINKAIWLPGSQTKLALVTADFVKIYELSEDTISPQYYFLVAVGKIRDCTFVYNEGIHHMLLIASSGYIYTQELDEESLAKHGDFYVTNTLDLDHPHIKDVNGQLGGGGVSVYYSSVLQLLFFSFSLGRSFMAPLTDVEKGVKCVIQLQTGLSSTKSASKGPPQPLCQWTEIQGHPGIICAMMHTSNNPVVFMLKPDNIMVQEIKAQSSKAKIMDMVAIRHTVSGSEKTTLILLCEDGSLRIYTANNETTNYWLSSEIQPTGNQLYNASIFNKNIKKTKKGLNKMQSTNQKNICTGISNSFPVDFFEHCVAMPDVEFGGNDLLQIYNTQKLKSRLCSTGMFVASTKPIGFTLEITNSDPSLVITGIRILIGSQDLLRAPQNVTILGRTIITLVRRPRWFDIPLTREEALQSDKKLSVFFGRSQDPDNVTMLDAIKVYGKTKENFGWPDEVDETNGINNCNQANGNDACNKSSGSSGLGIPVTNEINAQTITLLDKMTATVLEVLDSALKLLGGPNIESKIKQELISVTTEILLLPTPNPVQVRSKCVLATVYGNRNSYHAYKDHVILDEVYSKLTRFSKISDPKNIDPEAFYRLILLTRGIAVTRPQLLTKICLENHINILPILLKMTKTLYKVTPKLIEPTSVVKWGLSHTEATIYCLVEIIYAFAISDNNLVEEMTKLFVELLLDPSKVISHSTKEAMIFLMSPRIKRRRVAIESPPICSTPTPGLSNTLNIPKTTTNTESNVQPTENDDFSSADGDNIEPNPNESGGNQHALASLEALLGVGGFPQLFELQQDADDEAIMDIAIALSLQENEGDIQSLQQGIQNLQNIHGQGLQNLENVNNSGGEINATGGGSDDEGSNAATEGSTLRTSPAEPPGSGGSESGGSGVESIGGTSGRSSTYEDQATSPPPRSENLPSTRILQDNTNTKFIDESSENENSIKLHSLRTTILNKMVNNIGLLKEVNGNQTIPLMQVILMLTMDLDGSKDADQKTLNSLLSALIDFLEIIPSKAYTVYLQKLQTQCNKAEVNLVILCFLGILMGKTKSSIKAPGTTSPPDQFKDNAYFVGSVTANMLLKHRAAQYCLAILETFLPYWKKVMREENSEFSNMFLSGSGPTNTNLLKPVNYGPKPDISSLFPQNYFKGTNDIFEAYSQILTEISVRLPYQILKASSGQLTTLEWYHKFCQSITFVLCEYMMLNLSPMLRRQVRKLLMYICGNKEKFRLLRDGHSLNAHINAIKKTCNIQSTKQFSGVTQNPVLNYDTLVEFTEYLRACQEVATVRTGNWQRFCLVHVDVLASLIQICCFQLDEGISTIILQLLQAALCASSGSKLNDTKVVAKARQERDKSEESDLTNDSKFDPSHCSAFINQIFLLVSDKLLRKFFKLFLLETNTTSIRWQMHGLVYAIYTYSNDRQKERLLNLLWDMWPLMPAYGKRTAQFVDILGYLTLSTKSISEKLPEYTEQAVDILRQQNELLMRHPNAALYLALGQVLELDGYFLESEPCLVCNNPELPMSNIKLVAIKSDSKFTTTTTIVKLIQSHTISKIMLRIADLKRTKMVRTMKVYYNNRTVQAVVELKNKPSLWHKARKVTLQSGQTDVRIDFPLPITACNLMIEYVDFYETVAGSSENLQCPRCSSAVPAYPGVCGNCGENVFQCHKCRAINYDEKDPFLCHSCGFCKYAKFDYSINGRACCAVDPIESAEDRSKTVQTIHSSLEKADRIYKQLQANKQILELLVQKIAEHKLDRSVDESMGTIITTSQVNKVIQLLAQKYCVESRASFEELTKVVQKVKACRRELVAYDRSQMDIQNNTSDSNQYDSIVINRCYGCALASTEQCLTLLRAMASNLPCRIGLCNQGLVNELAKNNMKRGSAQIQEEVRNLLCLLTRDLPDFCENLCIFIKNRTKMALNGMIPLPNLDVAVRQEMQLLEALISQDDSCWEQKLKVVFELFIIACRDTRGPIIPVIHPCLNIIQTLISPPLPTSKFNKDMAANELTTLNVLDGITVDYRKWLAGDEQHTYVAWKLRMPKNAIYGEAKFKKINDQPMLQSDIACQKRVYRAVFEYKKSQTRKAYLTEKYVRLWRRLVLTKNFRNNPLELSPSWLQPLLFNTNSRYGRQLACSLMNSLSRTHERKREILNLFTGFLQYVGKAGEASSEFLVLYKSLADETPWRQYLSLRGVLSLIANLLNAEIVKIHHLEETSLSSDLAQGYALCQFVELLSMFLESFTIRQVYKSRLLGSVLQGYLSLRKLVVQRTRLIDDAQDKLLEMLEEMTSGTEEETKSFMMILINTVANTPLNDIKTPVFIFERLHSIIHPEESDDSDYFLTLVKDPQQEDFLQGRMLGNPYSSSDPGMGPLMRDVKNKICTDCELIALLEDDNGMELLVNNKIISLDLPVKDVYKKIWLAEGGERDAMRVVYRMRGLLGDATEEFVETLNNKSQEEIDNEQLYRMANVLAVGGGLLVMLERMSSLQNISRTRELLQVLLKLFLLCVKVRKCLEVLCQPELGAINIFLQVLQLTVQCENDLQYSAITEQLLEIMETILSKAASGTLDSFLEFSLTFGGPEYVIALISCTECNNVKISQSVVRHLIRVLAALVYGNEVKMALLCNHFKGILDFDKFDSEHKPEDEFKMELFCILTNQIEHNSIGGTLKDYIISLGIVNSAISYITKYAPCVKPTLLRTDSDELKEFISKPSLKYILRFLTGLALGHGPTQIAISKDIIPIIHRLEQVSSDEHVGSLAENLLEALCTDPVTSKRVQEVRDFTRTEKKRLAMATREKQLDALGMRTNEKGQVTAKGSILQKIEKLREETGLTCFICREGYACQSSKVLGIYTFTKRTNVEEFELKPRKTLGYTTVTHFNIVHIDCHTSAIRLARGRDEWERASLQNASTRCNGLLPLWGPEVSEAAFSTCMSRHNSYMQESTQRIEITFSSSIHDLKLLLARFAWEKSFHEDAGGGGPESNMHLVPYLLFYALYILLSARSYSREEKSLTTYLNIAPSAKWIESSYEVEGPIFQVVVSLALHSPEAWKMNKFNHLKRLLICAHTRAISPNTFCQAFQSSSEREVKDYSVYKPYLMMWSLINTIYEYLLKDTPTTKDEEDWPISIFDHIRHSDEVMLKLTDKILEVFTTEFLPCTSFSEFCDVAGLWANIENPDVFLKELIEAMPTTTD